jgi:hypothetical protein
MRWAVSIIVVLCAGCWSNGKNGHDKVEVRQGGSVTSGMMTTEPSRGDIDGNWYCFELSGELRETDTRETCQRTREDCEYMREAARSQFSYQATECEPHQTAVCFPWEHLDTGMTGERCTITGEECERMFRALTSKKLNGCAIQTNEIPPSSPDGG